MTSQASIPHHASRQAGALTGLALTLPVTTAVMGVVLLAPALPQLEARFGAVEHAEFLVPMILTMPALCVALFSWIAGAMGDAIGRRWLLLWSMALYAGFGAAPVLLDNIYAILATRVGVGICEAMILTLSTAMIGDNFSGRAQERWLASQTAIATLSSLVLFNVGGWLGGLYGWRGPFLFYGANLFLLLGVLIFTHEQQRKTQTIENVDAPATSKPGPFPWERLLGICLVTLFASVMFYTVQIQASVGLNALGVRDPQRIGFLTSVASLGVPLGALAFRALGGLRLPALLMLEFAALGIGFFLMARASEPLQFLVGAGINQVGAGLILPTLLTWALRNLSYEARGRGTGLWQSAFALGQFLSALLVPLMTPRGEGLSAPLQLLCYACTGAALVSAASYVLRIAPRLRSSRREAS